MTSLRVALVESSPLIRARVQESLAEVASLEIVGVAETETEARTLLRSIDWDVLVIDLQLREGTGLGVLKMLAEAPRTGSQTIIVLTHFTFPQYRRKSAMLGVHHFFDKARESHCVRDVLAGLAAKAA